MSAVNELSTQLKLSGHRLVAPSLTSSEKENRARICKGSIHDLMSSTGRYMMKNMAPCCIFFAPSLIFFPN